MEVAGCLQDVAREFHKSFQDAKKATIAGSTAGIVGGTLGAVGFGLSFFTFGASLILTAVGTGIAAAGGITAGGAAIGEGVRRKRTVEKAQALIERYEKTRNDVLQELLELAEHLGQKDLNHRFPLCCRFIAQIVGGSAKIAWSVAWKLISNIVTGVRLGQAAAELALEGTATVGRLTVVSVKAATSTAARGLHIAGGVVGIALIPLDIGFLVHSAHAVATDKMPDTSKEISAKADKLLEMCPSKSSIDEMIEDTIRRMEMSLKYD
ncbi:hypothetical protein DPMN_023701 [Dreissena polymorpha]|uniref:Apolipoprotein L3 n=2 Tax=Dreissena polymorpha TaxID=45954 RepID=A0A9D4RBM2_DREPO|nr:hypothetical protein DPMN_023701 [Dreissena polymorpha]